MLPRAALPCGCRLPGVEASGLLTGRWCLPELRPAAAAGTAGIAAAWPSNSFELLTITGASSVALVCFVIPVANHFLLFFSSDRWGCSTACMLHALHDCVWQVGAQQTAAPSALAAAPSWHVRACRRPGRPQESEALLGPGAGGSKAYPHCSTGSLASRAACVGLPLLVLAVGLTASGVTLWTMSFGT